MHNASRMRILESLCDLLRDRQCFVERNRTLSDPIGQRRAVNQFHHERLHRFVLLQPVDRRDVRMIQLRKNLRFTLETAHAVGICGEVLWKNFYRDTAAQLRICRAIHLAHSAFAEKVRDLVRAESGPDCDGHEVVRIIRNSMTATELVSSSAASGCASPLPAHTRGRARALSAHRAVAR